MWQTDIVIMQTETSVNEYGSIKKTYADDISINCDVQDVDKEFVFKKYGISTNTEVKQLFDLTELHDVRWLDYEQWNDVETWQDQIFKWFVGSQVKFQEKMYWVKLVHRNYKMGGSNSTYVILERVS